MTSRIFIVAAGISGMWAVGIGAFGAHVLSGRLPAPLFAAYQTGAQYHLAHTLALLGVAALAPEPMPLPLAVAGWAFVCGIALFSGSLYALALSGIRAWGAVTPVGGVMWLVAWGALAAWAAARGPKAHGGRR